MLLRRSLCASPTCLLTVCCYRQCWHSMGHSSCWPLWSPVDLIFPGAFASLYYEDSAVQRKCCVACSFSFFPFSFICQYRFDLVKVIKKGRAFNFPRYQSAASQMSRWGKEANKLLQGMMVEGNIICQSAAQQYRKDDVKPTTRGDPLTLFQLFNNDWWVQ
jgi:hypothetical protein